MKNKQYYTAGTGTKSKTNNTTLPEQVQNEKQTILHCRNRYTMCIIVFFSFCICSGSVVLFVFHFVSVPAV
jgi:hypothetical protein